MGVTDSVGVVVGGARVAEAVSTAVADGVTDWVAPAVGDADISVAVSSWLQAVPRSASPATRNTVVMIRRISSPSWRPGTPLLPNAVHGAEGALAEGVLPTPYTIAGG